MHLLQDPKLLEQAISKVLIDELHILSASTGQERKEQLRYFGGKTKISQLNLLELSLTLGTLKQMALHIEEIEDFKILLATFGDVASSLAGEARNESAEDILELCSRLRIKFDCQDALVEAGSDAIHSIVSSRANKEEPLKDFLRSSLNKRIPLQKLIALKTLSKLRYTDEGLIQDTIPLLVDADPLVRENAQKALKTLQRAKHPLKQILIGENPERPLKAYLKIKEPPYLATLKEIAITGFLMNVENLSRLAESLAFREVISKDDVFYYSVRARRKNALLFSSHKESMSRVSALQELILEKKKMHAPGDTADSGKKGFKRKHQPPKKESSLSGRLLAALHIRKKS